MEYVVYENFYLCENDIIIKMKMEQCYYLIQN